MLVLLLVLSLYSVDNTLTTVCSIFIVPASKSTALQRSPSAFYTSGIKISGEYIYFQKKAGEYNHISIEIHKMRLDGGEIQMLTDVECDCYIIDEQSGWIYY